MPEESELSNESPPDQGQWERELVNRLAFSALAEQRRTRRWGIFFKFAILAYLMALLVLYLPLGRLAPSAGEKHTALVEVSGIISDDSEASADNIVAALRAAFKDDDTAGVILRINSPGGSPVQAGYVNDEIGRLRKKHPKIPLYAVITDMCASGGYYIAAAADRIYADKASVVGSIGVLMNGFGFVGTMEKLGVERRLLTAGESKGMLDPFSPANPTEVAHIEGVLNELHGQFIEVVKRGRGDRLTGGEELFSGLVWSGERSVELGLVDALGSSSYVAREIIGVEEIRDFTPRRDLLERIADRIGMAMATGVSRSVGVGNLRLQ